MTDHLPPELQAAELVQPWLKDQSVADVLTRLVHSQTVSVNYDDIAVFLGTDRQPNGRGEGARLR